MLRKNIFYAGFFLISSVSFGMEDGMDAGLKVSADDMVRLADALKTYYAAMKDLSLRPVVEASEEVAKSTASAVVSATENAGPVLTGIEGKMEESPRMTGKLSGWFKPYYAVAVTAFTAAGFFYVFSKTDTYKKLKSKINKNPRLAALIAGATSGAGILLYYWLSASQPQAA
jgi:hypothetical protein